MLHFWMMADWYRSLKEDPRVKRIGAIKRSNLHHSGELEEQEIALACTSVT